MLMEIVQQHGNNGVIEMPIRRLALEMHTTTQRLTPWLTLCKGYGKVSYTVDQSHIKVDFKNFIKWQHNFRIKTHRIVSQTVQRIDIERDIERDKETTKESGVDQAFEAFWKTYPRREGRGKALAIWTKLKPSLDIQAKIKSAVEAQKQSPQWQKDGGQFIPHPATWLNQSRWLDEAMASINPYAGCHKCGSVHMEDMPCV